MDGCLGRLGWGDERRAAACGELGPASLLSFFRLTKDLDRSLRSCSLPALLLYATAIRPLCSSMSTPTALKLLTLLNVTAARPPPSNKRSMPYASSDSEDDEPPAAVAAKSTSKASPSSAGKKAKKTRRIVWNDDLEQGPSGSGRPTSTGASSAGASGSSTPSAATAAPAAGASKAGKGKKGKQVEVEGADSSDDEAGGGADP